MTPPNPGPHPILLTPATIAVVSTALAHPFGNRATDPQLAQAVLQGNLGLRRAADPRALYARALRDFPGRRAGLSPLRQLGELLRTLSRRWYLRRLSQVDQDGMPWCVDATRCHHQLALPTGGGLTHPLGAIYAMCKEIDPWPNEDGTSAYYLIQVLERLGQVESSWWYTGPEDADAALRWLTETGGMMFGANWPEEAFRTRRLADGTTDGVLEVPPGADWRYGHETYLIGRQRSYKRMGPHIEGVQSWGEQNFGVRGRFFIPEQTFFDRWMEPSQGWGDLVGVVETRA